MAYRTLHVLVLVLLFISFVFQIVSLSTPGWFISVNSGTETYNGVFYIKVCPDGASCESKSKLEEYNDAVKILEDSGQDQNTAVRATLDYEYNRYAAMQVFLVLALVFTIACLALQLYKCYHDKPRFVRLTGIASACLALASGLMIVILALYYIEIERGRDITDYSNGSFYLIFPYSVFLYTLAFIAHLACIVMYMVELYRRKKQLYHENWRRTNEWTRHSSRRSNEVDPYDSRRPADVDYRDKRRSGDVDYRDKRRSDDVDYLDKRRSDVVDYYDRDGRYHVDKYDYHYPYLR